jgi:2Fe-2S ferredoxin
MSFQIERTIRIHVMVHEKEFVLDTYPNEYSNLMMLIYDKIYPHDFGDCKGIGRCGTCHIKILTPTLALSQLDRNERTTLSRLEASNIDSRLACQILINSSIDGLHVEIMNDDEPGLY